MDQAKQITEKIQEAMQKDADRTGSVVFNGILDNPIANPLPESIFKNYFLPLFLGLRNDGATLNWMAQWVSIAGSPMSEVVIIDDNTKQELFRVPPIFNTTSLYMTKTEGDLGDIFKRFFDIKTNNPMAGLSFLLAGLEQKTIDLTTSIDHGGILDRWVAIITRYGYLANYQSAQKTTQEDQQKLDDFFDF